jgi:enoyl-CoA hydratase
MLRRRRTVGKEAFQKLAGLQKPVVAVVQGAAVGAGAEIALIADFAYAVAGARFRWPEVVWGSLGATQRLSRRVGRAVAKELLFTGAFIDAHEALRLGVVNRVVEEAEVETVVSDVAASIAARPPVTLRETKRAVDLGTELPLSIGLEVERAALEISLASEEWKRGLDDFKNR